MEMEYRLNSS